MRRFKVGAVGLGRIGRQHISALSNLSSMYSIVAVCDSLLPDNKMSEIYPSRTYRTLQEMLLEESLDFVVLCTPNGLHYGQALEVARSGVNLICEKPMVFNVSDFDSIISAFKKESRQIFLVSQLKTGPSLKLFNKVIENNDLGKIRMIQMCGLWSRPQSYYNDSPWRGSAEMDGGVLRNQFHHLIDIVAPLFGPIKTLSASCSRFLEIQTEDSIVISGKTEAGTLISGAFSVCAKGANVETSIAVIGEHASVKLYGPKLENIAISGISDSLLDLNSERSIENTSNVKLFESFYETIFQTLQTKSACIFNAELSRSTYHFLDECYSALNQQAFE